MRLPIVSALGNPFPEAACRLAPCSLPLVLLAAFLVGCGAPEEITTYQAPKPKPPVRMLGAMIPVKGGAWFFKFQGPHGLVSEHAEEFWGLIESVRFDPDTGEPSWDLPEDWKRKPAERGQMRYVTLVPPGDFPLEVAVSSFDQMNMTDSQFRLANINRWRRLLSAKEVTEDKLDSVIQRRDLDQWEALCVDLSGEESRGGQPMAGMANATPPSPPRSDRDPTYEKPADWTDQPLKPFSIATFALPAVDGSTAVVTISQVGGGLPANAGRWFGQAGVAPPRSADELAGYLKPLQGAQGDASMMVLSKDEEPDTKTLAIVAMQHQGQDWYVKYTGTRKDWDAHRGSFEALVKSIDFSGESQ